MLGSKIPSRHGSSLLRIFKRPFRWSKNRKNAILGHNISWLFSHVKGTKLMAMKASWVPMQILHGVASTRLMAHPCSLWCRQYFRQWSSPQLRLWQKLVEPFLNTRAMSSSFKNSLQGVEDCNKPTLGYLMGATSQSINMRHLYCLGIKRAISEINDPQNAHMD